MRPFQWKKVIKDNDVTAKAEFLGLQGDNSFKADFQDSNLATFWQRAGG
jgi:hypothetical protein